MLEKERLFRFAHSREGIIRLETEGMPRGKGLYLCREGECLEAFLKGRKFRKRFHENIDEESMRVLQQMADNRETGAHRDGLSGRLNDTVKSPGTRLSAILPDSEGCGGFE